WVQLGTDAYYFHQGFSGSVVMTNEDIDLSGNMFAGGVKFEYQTPEAPDKNYTVNYLGTSDAKPVINGLVSAGEWDAAEAAGTGYVLHNNPAVPAVEDGSFRMLFDDSHLYILFEMNNSYLAGYTTPPPSYGYFDLLGDRINFFLSPFGTSTEPFYRILFSPNPSDGNCYVWSQASLIKTTDANVGRDWVAGGDIAYTHVSGQLTVEYRVPWSEFDYPGISVAMRPESGTVWGVQPCITNEISAGVWESVNWEPDDTPSYVYGVPFGGLQFNGGASSLSGWELY
ncbi:MAG TPA: hypothetical protein PKH07_18350, partial [bacterium]|nr:hypothetical protein [bacterium]